MARRCFGWVGSVSSESIAAKLIISHLSPEYCLHCAALSAGSAVASGHSAGHTLLCTHIAASICGIVWIVLSVIDDGQASIVAALNGSIAGLAGVTPASGFIHSQSAAVLGIVLGFASYYGVKLIKGKFEVDDALDVSSVHGITGRFDTHARVHH